MEDMCTKQEVNDVVKEALDAHEEREFEHTEVRMTEIVNRELTRAFWKLLAWGGIPLLASMLSIGALYLQTNTNTEQLNNPNDRFTQSEGDAERKARETADENLQRQIDNNQASVIKTLDEMKVDIRFIRDNL